MRLTKTCPICNKNLEQLEQLTIGSEILRVYKCGHAFTQEKLELPGTDLILDSLDGKKHARPYQVEGVKFILGVDEYENYHDIRGSSCVLADQMRLGKTPQFCLAARNLIERAKAKGGEYLILILCSAANIFQWQREVQTWIDNKPNSVWIIQGTKSFIPPGFQVYICSMNTFGRKGMSDQLLEFGFKLVGVDECHSFKNTDSQRSQALTAFLKNIERSSLTQVIDFSCPFCKSKGKESRWTEEVTINTSTLDNIKRVYKISHCPECFGQVSQSAAAHIKVSRNCEVVMLSGTPIKNRADEWFVPLNLIAPEVVPSLTNFRRRWLEQDAKGKWSRVSRLCYDRFQKEIQPFVLRREKEDVYKDIPKLNRIFTPIEVTDERLKKAYNRVLDDLDAKHPTGDFSYFQDIGELMILRQICGLAKVQFAADYVETFLEESERMKIAIGVHHHSVRDEIRQALQNYGTCKIDGQDSPQQKDRIAHKYFETAPEQVLVLGMQAAKEGLEMPYIDTAIVLEREFTSTEEEQFEYRFYNPDLTFLKEWHTKHSPILKNPDRKVEPRNLENKSTVIEYLMAIGTIDVWFYNLVEEKRKIFGETMSKHWSIDQDAASFKELMEQTVSNRLK